MTFGDAVARNGLFMQCSGFLAGARVQALFDTGAEQSFVSTSFLEKAGLGRKVLGKGSPAVATAANGSAVQIEGEVTCKLNLWGHVSKVRCLVADLGISHELILGQPWLQKQQAVLSYGSLQVAVGAIPSKRVVLQCNSTELRGCDGTSSGNAQPATEIAGAADDRGAEFGAAQLISAVQCKRMIKKKQVDKVLAVQISREGNIVAGGPDLASDSLKAEMDALVHAFTPSVFRNELPPGLPPERQIDHLIRLKEGAKPYAGPSYRLSPVEMQALEKEIKSLLSKGLIEPSSAEWGAPVFFITKKVVPGSPPGTPKELRMVVDFRRINAQTHAHSGTIPNIADLHSRLGQAKYFTSLDLTSGYHQVRIADEDVPKTSFRTPMGFLFCWRVVCFGLRNAPQTFQALMNKLLRPYSDFCMVYIDDLCIFSSTAAEHVAHVRGILQVLKDNRLYAKPKKCRFAQEELHFLGHVVTAQGIKPDPAKVAAVQDWPVPRDTTELRSWVGLCTYFRQWVQGFSTLMRPLHNLLKKDAVFSWTAECQDAFERMKLALVLVRPDFTAGAPPFDVWCDACDQAIGAVLLQGGKVIAYEARSLNKHEINYTTGEKELLAVVHALTVWRCYLEGSHSVRVMTDHAPNTYLPSQQSLSRRQARWSGFLQRFATLSWHYKPGRINVADPVSRAPNLLNRSATDVAAENWQLWLQRLQRGPVAASVVNGGSGAEGGSFGALLLADLANPEAVAKLFVTTAPPPQLLDRIRQAYQHDSFFNDLESGPDHSYEDELWKVGAQRAVMVPDDTALRDAVVDEAHRCGHLGRDATLSRLKHHYFRKHGGLSMASMWRHSCGLVMHVSGISLTESRAVCYSQCRWRRDRGLAWVWTSLMHCLSQSTGTIG